MFVSSRENTCRFSSTEDAVKHVLRLPKHLGGLAQSLQWHVRMNDGTFFALILIAQQAQFPSAFETSAFDIVSLVWLSTDHAACTHGRRISVDLPNTIAECSFA